MSDEKHTVRLHRVLKAPPARVYKAFLDPDALAAWLPPYGFTAKVHSIDARVGGSYKMSFTNFSTGSVNSFGGEFLELKENELLRYTDQFDDPAMPQVIEVTINLKAVMAGTELRVVQANLPPQIPIEYCYLGWQDSLMKLALLVDPEIPDGA